MLLPLGRLLLEAVAPGGEPGTAALRAMLGNPATWRAFGNTLQVAAGATLLATLVGGAVGLLVALTDLRGKTALVFAFMLPLLIPPQVTALAWMQAFGPGSQPLQALGLAPPPGTAHPLYSPAGIILLLGVQQAPLVFITLRAGLRGLPRELVEAARTAGAGPLTVFRTVILPLSLPALLAGAALAFVAAAGNFGIQAMLGIPARYPTLVTLIYQRLADFGPSVIPNVAMLSLLLAVVALLGIGFERWVLGGRDLRLVGVPGRPLAWRLGRWRLPAEFAVWIFLVAILALPLAALVGVSLVPAYGVPLSPSTLTAENYLDALWRHAATARAFQNSLLLAGLAALLLAGVSGLMGYLLVWRRSRLVAALGTGAELTYALPGIVVALAMILLFLRPLPVLGISLYGTLAIIFLAYVANFLALALRPAIGGFRQTDPALEEAARMCGAGLPMRLRTVILPLVAPLAAAGAILVFMTAVNEIQVSVLLVKTGTETLGTVVFFLEESGSTVMASAVAVLIILLVLALMAIATLLARHLPRGVLPWQV